MPGRRWLAETSWQPWPPGKRPRRSGNVWSRRRFAAARGRRAGPGGHRSEPASSGQSEPGVAVCPAAGRISILADRLPQLGVPGTAPPPAAAPANFSPYNLPPETNPLVRAARQAAARFSPWRPPEDMQPRERRAAATAGGRCRCPGRGQPTRRAGRLALDQGDLQNAARMAEQAESLNVPDNAFAAGETRPWQMTLEVNRAMVRREGVVQASGNGRSEPEPQYPVAQGRVQPGKRHDTARPRRHESAVDSARPPQQPQPPPGPPQFRPISAAISTAGSAAAAVRAPEPTPGQQLFQEGLQALVQQDRKAARCENSPKPGNTRISSIPKRGSSSRTS